ncbi:uncharacterized protein IL334_006889 [Kwoniella shivajii]|uniref:Amidohydrolase 3 domain-containing protein n=1 Tax=Kwoniella shivajii TaxID=564305 RepID=A0ABZ1D7Y3_9TREE|nr:hypothetical protein IL334_006889 [Kwoniella shivajii]
MVYSTLIENVALVGYPEDTLYSVLLKDGKVKSIRPAGESTAQINGYSNVKVLDMKTQGEGKQWIAPSLIDWHVHFRLNALTSHRFDLQSCQSAQEVLDQVKHALTLPEYDPEQEMNFVGINMRNSNWSDQDKLDRKALDALASNRPIFLLFNGYHSMVVNSEGLKLGGYDPEKHDGYLYEQEAFTMSRHLSNVKVDTLDKWMDDEARKAAALGVTEIVDLEMDFNMSSWQRRSAKGSRWLRVHCGMYTEHLSDAIENGYKTGDVVPGTNGLVTVGPYKIVTDGSLGSQTAFCHDHYPGSPDNFGLLAYKPQTLADMIQRGIDNGFRLAVHAIGDHANRLTLQTIANASSPPLPGSTIEHAQLLDFDDLPLFKSLGLIASIQPCHLVDDRDLCHKFWPGREHRAYAFRSIVDAGVPIKMGSDCPIAPLQPWEAMAVAISRAGQGDEKNPFCEEQIIDLEVAWAGSTSNGKVRLEVGDRADLIIIPHNPLHLNAEGLRKVRPIGTMLAGDWTYRSF